MTQVAICYWGMTRSTRKVWRSHHLHLFNVLKENNIQYDAFMHTWETDQNIVWENDCTIPNDYEEYQLLNPTHFKRELQSTFLNALTFSEYFDQELYDKYGGDSPHEWRPQLIKNHLCALESQKRVTDMVIYSGNVYDYVIYIRPDVMISTPFEISWFQHISLGTIVLPNDEHHEGLNDRFAIVSYNDCSYYGKRIDEIIDFRKSNGRIVSEKYVKFIIKKYFKILLFIKFKFTLVRP